MNRQNLQRKQVKDGFDPLGMFKKEDKEKNKSEVKSEEEKEKLSSNSPIEIRIENETKSQKEFNTIDEIIYPILDPLSNPLHKNNSNNNKQVEKINPKNILISNDTFFINRDFIRNNFDFIKGENLIDYDEAYYKTEDMSLIGIIVLTDYRIMFKFRDEDLQTRMNLHEDYFKIPLFHITKIEKSNEKKNMTRYALDITLKDSRQIKFIIQNEQLKLFANMNNFVFPRDYNFYYSFSFKYKEASKNSINSNINLQNSGVNYEISIDGWRIYDPIQEYLRQGLIFEDENTPLKICELNKNFSLCSTYPEILVVPKALNDEEIKDASYYRTKNRFPVMSYVYLKNNKKRSNNTNSNGYTSKSDNFYKLSYPSIWRSSQTKSGITGQNRSSADEKLLKVIGQLSDRLIIYDARPYINALANRIKGGGFENVSNYSNTELHFCEIGNIHDVRASLAKMHSLCLNNKLSDNKKFLSTLEQTDWFNFIHLILKYSNEIAICIRRNYSVLVHCSDGWDRSTQLITTSEILIDPYYRTMKGLMILVEKEWLSFGHQFGLRNGIYTKEMHEDQRASIFLQWLDCLHQLLYQFPNAFEFNQEFLLFLADQCNSNLYGTFLFNCQQERFEKNIPGKTVSIWTDILNDPERLKKFSNPFYGKQNYFLSPNHSFHRIRLWEEFFFKYNPGLENEKIYLNYEKNVFVRSSNNFFVFNKITEKLNDESNKQKVDELLNVLADVYSKTCKSEVFKEFNETTKFYLSNLKIESQDIDLENKLIDLKENYVEKENVEDKNLEEGDKLNN